MMQRAFLKTQFYRLKPEVDPNLWTEKLIR